MRALLLIAALASASPALPQEAEASKVIATVNGEALSVADLERYLGTVHGSTGETRREAFDLDRLTFRMVNDTLLAQEARAMGLDQDGGIPERVRDYRDRLAVAALEREEVAERARPGDDEVRQAFEEQYRQFTLRVVTAYERPQADELLERLRAGTDMEALARERSVDPYALRGGQLKNVVRRDLQAEIADLASSLAPGELAGPVRTDLGWSVIRLEEARPADPERFPQVEKPLRRLVRHRKSQALRAALAARARERHPVRRDEAAVNAVTVERLEDGRLVPKMDDPAAVVARIGAGKNGEDLLITSGDEDLLITSGDEDLLITSGDEDLLITSGDYAKALLARWSGVRNEEAARASAPIILQKMIEERLLVAEARARGYGERREVQRAVRAFEAGLLISRYLEDVVAPGVEVGEEEMRAYYEAHQDELRKPPRIHLGQITVATLEEAERLAGLLREGADLGWLARQHSIDRFKARGGERGWVELGASGLDERLDDAPAGAVLDPVGVRGNHVVLKVMARQEQGVYPFQEVSGNVRQAVLSSKMRQAIEQLMETLRSRSEIAVDPAVLASLRVTGERTQEREEGGEAGARVH